MEYILVGLNSEMYFNYSSDYSYNPYTFVHGKLTFNISDHTFRHVEIVNIVTLLINHSKYTVHIYSAAP